MVRLYYLPQVRIHSIVQRYAAGKCGRQEMITGIVRVLKIHKVSCMNIYGYSVRLIEPNITPIGVLPVVLIISDGPFKTSHCPACGSGVHGYLGGESTVMCHDCGCIYEFREAGDANGSKKSKAY